MLVNFASFRSVFDSTMEALEFSEVIKTQAAQERRSATMEEIRLMGSTAYDIFIYNMYIKYSIRM